MGGSWLWIAAIIAAIVVGVAFAVWRGFFNFLTGKTGEFAGIWNGFYVDKRNITINEVLTIYSIGWLAWGTSSCTWVDNGAQSGTYRVRGIIRANCLMGIYIPAVSGEHDMGVFIVLIEAGSSPKSGTGLVTNFESSDPPPDGQQVDQANPVQKPLSARPYRIVRH